MCKFMAPKELRKRFEAYGHFYRLRRAEGDELRCRSTLEIVRVARVRERGGALLDRPPEILVFMMNPGSSYRWGDRGYAGNRVAARAIGMDARSSLVQAYPDKVQYQIMRVMARVGLSHVRVLNLSDIRESNSRTFLAGVRDEAVPADSILSSIRRDELAARAGPLALPIVAGWGRDARISPLATACESSLHGLRDALGVNTPLRFIGARQVPPEPRHTLLFDYPAPRGANKARMLDWVRTIARDVGQP